MRGSRRHIIVALVALVSPCSAWAEDEIFAPERIGMLSWNIGLGSFTPDSNSQLGEPHGEYFFPMAIGYRQSATLEWDFDLTFAHQTVKTPSTIAPPGQGTFFQGTVDARSSIDTEGFAGTVRYFFPQGQLEPYVGGGIGLYKTRFAATGQQLGFPMEAETSSTDLGFQFVAGLDIYITRKTAVAVELRNVKVNAGLGYGIGNIRAGGTSASMILRFY